MGRPKPLNNNGLGGVVVEKGFTSPSRYNAQSQSEPRGCVDQSVGVGSAVAEYFEDEYLEDEFDINSEVLQQAQHATRRARGEDEFDINSEVLQQVQQGSRRARGDQATAACCLHHQGTEAVSGQFNEILEFGHRYSFCGFRSNKEEHDQQCFNAKRSRTAATITTEDADNFFDDIDFEQLDSNFTVPTFTTESSRFSVERFQCCI